MTPTNPSLLDRHADARRYITNLVVVGGATRAQIADALAKRYALTKVPSPRTVTGWLADDGVRELIRELEDIRRDLSPGDDPAAALLPEPRDRAQDIADMHALMDECPSWSLLHARADLDPDFDDDDAPRRVLVESETPEALEAASAALLGDFDYHEAVGAEPGYRERVERVMAEAA